MDESISNALMIPMILSPSDPITQPVLMLSCYFTKPADWKHCSQVKLSRHNMVIQVVGEFWGELKKKFKVSFCILAPSPTDQFPQLGESGVQHGDFLTRRWMLWPDPFSNLWNIHRLQLPPQGYKPSHTHPHCGDWYTQDYPLQWSDAVTSEPSKRRNSPHVSEKFSPCVSGCLFFNKSDTMSTLKKTKERL